MNESVAEVINVLINQSVHSKWIGRGRVRGKKLIFHLNVWFSHLTFDLLQNLCLQLLQITHLPLNVRKPLTQCWRGSIPSAALKNSQKLLPLNARYSTLHSLHSLHSSHYIPLTIFHPLHSTHYIPLTIFHRLHSTHYIPLTTFHSLHSTHYIPLTTFHSLHSTHYIPLSTFHSLHSTHYIPLTTFHSLHSTHHIPLTTSRCHWEQMIFLRL